MNERNVFISLALGIVTTCLSLYVGFMVLSLFDRELFAATEAIGVSGHGNEKFLWPFVMLAASIVTTGLFVIFRQMSYAHFLPVIVAYIATFVGLDTMITWPPFLVGSALLGLINGVVAWPVLRDSVGRHK